jgi:hypothetical protein
VTVDFFAAEKAVAEIAGFDPAKRALDLPELPLTPPAGLPGRKLCLHGSHAGKTAQSGRIRLRVHCRFFGGLFQMLKLGSQTNKPAFELFELCFIDSRLRHVSFSSTHSEQILPSNAFTWGTLYFFTVSRV